MARLFNNVVLASAFSTAILSCLSLASPRIPDTQVPLHSFSEHAPLYEPDPALETWIENQRNFALNRTIANIGPNGENATGTGRGCILASPSKRAPNYFYQWIRDGAIAVSALIDQWVKSKPRNDEISENLLEVILDYIDMQEKLQGVENPSGGFYSGGLGEPKFGPNGTAFTGNWGRPQRDGPALRASALISFLDAAKDVQPEILRNRSLMKRLCDNRLPPNSIIKADLEYVSHSWFEQGFDAWEEVNGLHFFTAMVQLKAMADGAALSAYLGDPGAAGWYVTQKRALAGFVRRFWHKEKGHLVSTLNYGRRSGLNCDLLLGSLHGGGLVFPPWSDELLVSMDMLIKQMSVLHPMPGNPTKRSMGVGIGRYAEDIYDGVGFDGGNAWFICTSSVAHVLYAAVEEFIRRHRLVITERNLGFFRRVNPSIVQVGELTLEKDWLFNATMAWMFEYADGFMEVVKIHAEKEGGHMAEQYDTLTGTQTGAKDLTWSYGSFLTAMEQRDVARRMLLQ